MSEDSVATIRDIGSVIDCSPAIYARVVVQAPEQTGVLFAESFLRLRDCDGRPALCDYGLGVDSVGFLEARNAASEYPRYERLRDHSLVAAAHAMRCPVRVRVDRVGRAISFQERDHGLRRASVVEREDRPVDVVPSEDWRDIVLVGEDLNQSM